MSTVLVFAQAFVGAIAHITGEALVALGDRIDPPLLSPREKTIRAVTAGIRCPNYVPDALVKEWR